MAQRPLVFQKRFSSATPFDAPETKRMGMTNISPSSIQVKLLSTET
jgi:hypothetical protein